MPLKKSQGNMYEWTDATHAHLGGCCKHKCCYCYIDSPRFGRPAIYTGDLRLIEKEFKVNYDEHTLMKVCGKYPATIFIEHCNDLFADNVPDEFIMRVFAHCDWYPENTYVFQTKNPARYFSYDGKFPKNTIRGCTIETNRNIDGISEAPPVEGRMMAMEKLTGRKFLTLEPILNFDVDILASWIKRINPEFLNLGADSKNHGLPEPTVEKIHALVEELKKYGIDLREKHNLQRLKEK